MEPWKFESNTIEIVTRKSFKLADVLLRDHVARALKAMNKAPGDVDFPVVYGRVAGELSNWSSAYLSWNLSRGTYKAKTQTFEELLDGLPAKIDDWDIDIQGAGGPTKPYRAGKPGYTELFPQGRKPFNSGPRDSRVTAMTTLGAALTGQGVPLATMATAVSDYAASMVAARDQQQQAEGNTDTLSTALEAQRLSLSIAMFRNVGRLMEKFGPSPMVGNFFDLTYIRDGATPPPDDAPAAPQSFTVATVAGQPASVQGAWAAIDEVTNYTIYRRLAGEIVWTNVGMSATPAILLTMQPIGVLLEYAVTATNDEGEGPRSVPDEITL